MSTTMNYFTIKRLEREEAESIQREWLFKSRSNTKRSYSVTNNEQRYMMLTQVLSNQMPIKEAAKKYGVKYTTAKHILNIYLNEGRINKKKKRVRKKKLFQKDY